MPTKKELQEQINKLKEENKELNELLNQSAGMTKDLVGFLQMIKLWDLFVNAMDTKTLLIEDVKEAIKNLKCSKCNSYCDCDKE
tara:strand:- start:589 stop:840 length:252 start_codon:yes stop_codon:yes gene_type:complete